MLRLSLSLTLLKNAGRSFAEMEVKKLKANVFSHPTMSSDSGVGRGNKVKSIIKKPPSLSSLPYSSVEGKYQGFSGSGSTSYSSSVWLKAYRRPRLIFRRRAILADRSLRAKPTKCYQKGRRPTFRLSSHCKPLSAGGIRAASRCQGRLDLREKRRQPGVTHGSHDPGERLA
jgi:hypothetical protein